MAEALITQGVALARWDRTERAHFIFQQAIQTALQVDALCMAGLAALALIEEVELDPLTLQAAYQQARDWLAASERKDVFRRLSDAAGKLAESLCGELSTDKANEILFTKSFDLQKNDAEIRSHTDQTSLSAIEWLSHSRRILVRCQLSGTLLHHRISTQKLTQGTNSDPSSGSQRPIRYDPLTHFGPPQLLFDRRPLTS
jgi:hypothetical protein